MPCGLLSAHHLRGWWTQDVDEVILGHGEGTVWVELPKLHWLAPARGSLVHGVVQVDGDPYVGIHNLVTRERAEFKARVEAHFEKENAPMMVCCLEESRTGKWTEVSRGFVLHPEWNPQRLSESRGPACLRGKGNKLWGSSPPEGAVLLRGLNPDSYEGDSPFPKGMSDREDVEKDTKCEAIGENRKIKKKYRRRKQCEKEEEEVELPAGLGPPIIIPWLKATIKSGIIRSAALKVEQTTHILSLTPT